MTRSTGTCAAAGEGLHKTFGGLRAVRDVTIALERGKIHGLVGPNGSGKTTLLNLLSGALTCDEGKVVLGGEDVTSAALHTRVRRGIARTFQHLALFDSSTAFENVLVSALAAGRGSSFLEYVGIPRERRRVRRARTAAAELLETFGVSDEADTPVSSLSYGQRRRVEIARAVATQPAVLLLDEPTAGMSDGEAWEIAKALQPLAAEGLALLLVDHNVGLVTGLCSEITVMDAGSVIAAGDPNSVINDPRVIDAYLG